jgi:hypothetical protein
MPISVRRASPHDLDWLLTQLKAFSRFFGSRKPLLEDGDEAYAREVLLGMVTQHLVLVAEKDDGTLVGLIGGYSSPHPFNPKIRLLAETFWWVDEQHRGSRAGLLLLKRFVEIGKTMADWLSCSLEQNSPVSDRVFTRMGFQPRERSYLLEVS